MNQRKGIAAGLIILIIGVVAFLVGVVLWENSPGLSIHPRSSDAQVILTTMGALLSIGGVVMFAVGGIIAAVAFAKGSPPERPR